MHPHNKNYTVESDLNAKKERWALQLRSLSLKAYSLMLNRGRSQNFQNLIFFAYFRSSPLRSTLPQRNQAKIILV